MDRIYKFMEYVNSDCDAIDEDTRDEAVVLLNDVFYFGGSHSQIVGRILDVELSSKSRESIINFRDQIDKVAFGSVILDNVMIFEDYQSFYSKHENTEEEEFYTLGEIKSLIVYEEDNILIQGIEEVYVVEKENQTSTSKYILDSLERIV